MACCAVGGDAWPLRAGSGTAALSPIAHRLVWPCTSIVRSVMIRPPRSSGRPSSWTTGWGLTPAVHTSVRDGMTSPVDRYASVAVTRSSVVPVRISIPRPRSSRVANSDRSGGTSIITRSRASTRRKRTPWVRQRG